MWLFVLVAPAAWAQAPAGGAGEVPAQPGGEQPAQVFPQMDTPHKSSITPDQMLGQGHEYRKQLDGIRLGIQQQVDQAKHDKDVIRLNCLLDKLTQVNVNTNMMDQALQALQDAVSRRDEGMQSHEYMRIMIINQKVQVLKTEADACVGAETNYIGPTKVVVEKPEGLGEGVDQVPPVFPPFTVVDHIPPASPHQ